MSSSLRQSSWGNLHDFCVGQFTILILLTELNSVLCYCMLTIVFTHPGLRLHYNSASSYLLKPVLIRSQIANPIGISPALSYSPGIPSTIFSPIVYSSVKSYPVPLLSFSNTLKLYPADIQQQDLLLPSPTYCHAQYSGPHPQGLF